MKKSNRRWVKVRSAADCKKCPDCGDPWCSKHKKHYADCECVGPTQDGYDYKTVKGVLYARKSSEG
jgi:hypothetical protein